MPDGAQLEKSIAIALRALRINVGVLYTLSKYAVAFGGVVFVLSWSDALDGPLPTWLRIYVAIVVALAIIVFMLRKRTPETPVAGRNCPRCETGLHYAGLECPQCGVLSFSNDSITLDRDT